jgi:predicted ATP-dependent Lon-type protease
MNQKLKDVFKGKVVNKALTINTGVDEFPRYVVEYLINNYCSEETFHEDMQKVVRRLEDRKRIGTSNHLPFGVRRDCFCPVAGSN